MLISLILLIIIIINAKLMISPQETLPWIKIKRFEAWFWSTVRCRWQQASAAATVLAQKWWSDLSKDLNWRGMRKHIKQEVFSPDPNGSDLCAPVHCCCCGRKS
jgi:hypothetical protein